ncbi:hypothetical protein T265_06430 [Opisthorchis viverrini]|uniref:Uncharacterized protein n=1 Tax=Opisthorchis viverrini TaxID=6198 RepID=A0A075ADV7_OPIVI|nr:hypothetical protein T265_06430 [Opisthorchis viverrini]KER26314.1 hypothetical protein T265_06430 [Opisthorchis viverrini]
MLKSISPKPICGIIPADWTFPSAAPTGKRPYTEESQTRKEGNHLPLGGGSILANRRAASKFRFLTNFDGVLRSAGAHVGFEAPKPLHTNTL